MSRITLSLLSIVLIMYTSCAQSKQGVKSSYDNQKITNWYQEAKQKARQRNYTEAHELYQKIIDKAPTFIDAYLMKGGLYYGQKKYQEARALFLKAIDINPEHNKEVYFSLALLENHESNYASAAQFIKSYLNRSQPEERKYEKAQEYYAQYQYKAEAIAHPLDIKKEKLPYPVNTDHSEYTPCFTADGKNMIFVRRLGRQEDLFITEWKDSSFSMPALIEEIATMDNEGVHTLSADGNTLIFTACNRRNSYGSCDLYYTKKDKNGKWQIPSNMGKRINTAAWESQPSLSADGSTLYFSSDRIGSVGGRDIWYTKRDSRGRWITPINLGGAINTMGNDETPFIHADGRTLYFRSNGRLGMGGYDLYMSKYDAENKRWSIPVGLGYPINTEADEGGLTIATDGKTAYYSSNEGQDDVDIFRFPLPEEIRPDKVTFIRGRVIDALSKELLDAQVVIKNYTDSLTITKTTGTAGTFIHALPIGNNFGFTIEKEGYIFYSEKIQLDSIASATEPYIIDFYLTPVEEVAIIEEKPIILNNIFFTTGSATLDQKSNDEINRLAKLLEENPSWNITITGHTDNIGTMDANLELSQDRAAAVVEALIRIGIEPSRLKSSGKGETQPIASNESAEGRQKNRRTEFTIHKTKE